MTILLIFVLTMAGIWFWQLHSSLPGSFEWRSERSWRREKQRLYRATTMELLDRVRDSLRYGEWQHFSSAKELNTSSTWTDLKLRQTLDSLFAELRADDILHERSGRDSSTFEIPDSGLGGIREVLGDRTGETRQADG